VAGVTATGQSGVQGGVADTTGMFGEQQRQGAADAAAAMSAGMSAENDRRHHYATDILPQGTAYGDVVNLPDVPDNAVPAANSSLYPWSGLEPTPADAGLAGDYPG
jgi:hypothetical protein